MMLSHFLNVSFTLPRGLGLDKGQDYWWLHVVFPYFILLAARWGVGGRSPHPARDDAQPRFFIFRTRIKRFKRADTAETGAAGSVDEGGMKILN